MEKMLAMIRPHLSTSELLQTVKDMCHIPAPTYKEEARMRFLSGQLEDAGIGEVQIDAAGNALGFHIAHPGDDRLVLVCAHADTACEVPGDTVETEDDGTYLCAHGVCDNAAGMTGVLTFARLLHRAKPSLKHNYLLAFTVGEEGLGRKRGMRHLVERFGGRLQYVVNVESHNIGDIMTASIGQERQRIRVTVAQKGGHSWADFGQPNAVAILARIIDGITRIPLPPDTSINVTALDSPQSINVIPSMAACSIEARALKQEHLLSFLASIGAIIDRERNVTTSIETESLGSVQASSLPTNHALTRIVRSVHRELRIETTERAANTDGDVTLEIGIPTITLATGNGDRIHSLEERLEKESFPKGVEQILACILTLDREMA